MVLSDAQILKEMERGRVIIDPFVKENLSTSSYDVSLGKYYFAESSQNSVTRGIYNIYNKKDVERVWGTEPKEAKKAGEVFKETYFEYEGISEDDTIILLQPGETILAHTNEFIGGKESITTMMKSRSSLGRNFIEVCKCAGWGDVGYTNRWTMEITNNSRFNVIPLVTGRKIAQIIFFETGELEDKDYTKTGNYQQTENFEELKKNWSPQEMIPKLYKSKK